MSSSISLFSSSVRSASSISSIFSLNSELASSFLIMSFTVESAATIFTSTLTTILSSVFSGKDDDVEINFSTTALPASSTFPTVSVITTFPKESSFSVESEGVSSLSKEVVSASSLQSAKINVFSIFVSFAESLEVFKRILTFSLVTENFFITVPET